MKIAEDSFFKECKKFEDLEKELFQKIKNLRDSVKGDKVYDDNKIDKESFHLTIFLESDLIAYSRLYKSSECEVSLQRFSVAQKYRNMGISKILMNYIFLNTERIFNKSSLILTSRLKTKEFYEKYDFEVYDIKKENSLDRFYMRRDF